MTASCGLCEDGIESGYLCPRDTGALARRLANLPVAYRALAGFLAPAVRGTGERSAPGGGAPPLPVNEQVLDLRYGGVAHVVEGWLAAVQEARGWGAPATGGSIEERVRRAARSLGANVEWIAAQFPGAGDLANEIRELDRSVLSIVGAVEDRGRRVGYCVAVDLSGVVCGATLRHRPGDQRLTCRWCGCVYEARDFMMLRHFQPEAA